MTCDFCLGMGRVSRVRELGQTIAILEDVTCPRCVRGVTVLGTHEMLRTPDGIHRPGERIDPQYTLTGPGTFRIEPDE